MNYRLYNQDDFEALYVIEEVCFKPPQRFSRAYMRQLVKSRTAAAWVAEEGGVMAGFAIVEWHDTTRGISAYIPTIEVLPERRGHGVGRELLQRLEQSARDAGATAIELHVDTTNAGAIQLYESRGYRQRGSRDNFYAQGRPAYLYKKEFAPGNQAQ